MSDSSSPPSPPPPPPPPPSSTAPPLPFHGTTPFYHYSALGVAGLAIIALALPPRNFGPRTTLLTSSLFFSTNQLAYDYSGRSVIQRFSDRADKAQEKLHKDPDTMTKVREAIRAEKLRLRAQLPEDERRRLDQEDERKGKSKKSWVRDWDEKEKQALSDGRGYGGLIVDTVKEVFGLEEQSGTADQAKKKEDSTADKQVPGGSK